MKPSNADSALIASFIASRGVTRVDAGVATMTRADVRHAVVDGDVRQSSADAIAVDMERRTRGLSATFRGTYAGRKYYR